MLLLRRTSNNYLRRPTCLATRSHGDHSHSPRVQRTKSWLNSPGPRITLIGSVTNLGLVGGKAIAGVLSGSPAMVADAAHSMGDLVSDAVALGSLRLSSKPPDKDHPYGHGKFEEMGALVVSVLLCGTGVGVGLHSVELLSVLFQAAGDVVVGGGGAGLDPSAWLNSQIYDTGVSLDGESSTVTEGNGNGGSTSFMVLAASMAGCSIVAKEGLYRYTKTIGTEIGSPVLIANAHHHRSDALSSVVALGGIGGALAGLPWLDPVAGLVVSLMIVRSAYDIGWEATRQLTDTADAELTDMVSLEVKEFIKEQRGVTSFSHLRARRNGADALVDMHIVVEPMLTVSAAHILAELVRYRIVTNIKEVVDVTIHVDPEMDEDKFTQLNLLRIASNPIRIEKEVKTMLMENHVENGILSVTHTGVHILEGKVSVEVTIEVDPNFTVRKASEIAANARRRLERHDSIAMADIHLELDDGGQLLERERRASQLDAKHV